MSQKLRFLRKIKPDFKPYSGFQRGHTWYGASTRMNRSGNTVPDTSTTRITTTVSQSTTADTHSSSQSGLTTNNIVMIVLGILVSFTLVYLIILYIYWRALKKQIVAPVEERSDVVSNIYSKLPFNWNRIRVPYNANLPNPPSTSGSVRNENVIPPASDDQIIYAQLDIVSPPQTRGRTHNCETDRTIYAEIQIPNIRNSGPTVQYQRGYEDTYGHVFITTPDPRHSVGHSSNLLANSMTQSAERKLDVNLTPDSSGLVNTGAGLEEPLYGNVSSKV